MLSLAGALPWLSIKYVAGRRRPAGRRRCWRLRATSTASALVRRTGDARRGALPRRPPRDLRRMDCVRDGRPLRRDRRARRRRARHPNYLGPVATTGRAARRRRVRSRRRGCRVGCSCRSPSASCAAGGRPDGTRCAFPLAGWMVTATFVALTMHGWWWPGRQVVVVLPLGGRRIGGTVAGVPTLRRPFVDRRRARHRHVAWTTVEAITRRHVLVVDFDQTTNPWIACGGWCSRRPDGGARHQRPDVGLGRDRCQHRRCGLAPRTSRQPKVSSSRCSYYQH